MSNFFNGLSDRVKEVIALAAGSIILILITAAFTGSASVKTINATIDSRIDERITAKLNEQAMPMLTDIKKSVDFLVESSYSDYVVKIDKQVEKIKKDPSDIKMVDIEDVLTKWKSFPDSRKTDVLVAKYTVVKQWYEKQ